MCDDNRLRREDLWDLTPGPYLPKQHRGAARRRGIALHTLSVSPAAERHGGRSSIASIVSTASDTTGLGELLSHQPIRARSPAPAGRGKRGEQRKSRVDPRVRAVEASSRSLSFG